MATQKEELEEEIARAKRESAAAEARAAPPRGAPAPRLPAGPQRDPLTCVAEASARAASAPQASGSADAERGGAARDGTLSVQPSQVLQQEEGELFTKTH